MRIPLDYYRILGLPIQATIEQLEMANRDLIMQLPRREYSQIAIDSRKQLLDQAYGVLSDSDQRRTYDASFMDAIPKIEATTSVKAREKKPQSPSIEISEDQLVGALLLLLELGEYELVLQLGRPYLSSSKISAAQNQQAASVLERSDTVLTVAHACLELGREQWQQGTYTMAAEYLETGQNLLLSEGLFPTVRGEITADLYKLRPYRILELLAQSEEKTSSTAAWSRSGRRQGVQMLRDMLEERGGIDGTGDDGSGLGIDDFLRFVQQLRGYMTSEEQQTLFESEALRPSAVATYLAVYALLARGFAQHKLALINRAKRMLMRLGNLQDVHLEQAVCALLLGQTSEASRALELSQEYEQIAFIREHSQGAPDLLPGLCLYGERWLHEEVFTHFQDLHKGSTTLKDYFTDKQVQSYLEALPQEINNSSDWTVVQHQQISQISATSDSKAVVRIIEQAAKDRVTSLNLRGKKLRALPPEIGQLRHLRQLNLGFNQLRALPPEIGRLRNLTQLYLDSNQLRALPPEIGQLHNLTELNLWGNKLTALPPEIGQLRHLRQLNLGFNQLRALPPEIGQLHNLTKLNLSGNPLTSSPPEILQQGIEAVFAYLSDQIQAKQPQWVSKLIVVGEGGVGKTSLLRALRGEPFNPQESTTHGIAIRTLKLAHPTQAGVTMQLNAWDFGGQQIYHATHQFFLSNRSLFLLAWNARQGFEPGKLYYWLDTIKAVAPNSPILLVTTHIDERDADLPLSELRQQYPQIKGHCAISSRTGAGIDTLRQLIADTAAQLPLMGETWPLTWLNAANAIRKHSREYITLGQLNYIMTAHKVSPDSQSVLAQWLHELGDILYFQDHPELRDIVILKPQWVTEQISKVLESQEIQDRSGIFTRPHMAQLWPDIEPQMREHFLRLMERFDLSYRIRTEFETSDVSLVVERLPLSPPNYQDKWDAILTRKKCNEMSMKWKMNTLPAGIPTWSIARQHRFSTGIHWRKGALLADEPKAPKHLALVQAFPHQQELQLIVRGANPQDFFVLLKDGIEVTLARFPGLEIKRTIPCPGGDSQPCRHEFDYQQLEKRYEKNKHAIECPACLEDISVIKLLLGLDLNPVQQSSGLAPNNLILSHVEQLTKGQHDMLAMQIEMLKLIQREFTNAFHREQAKIESHCPNIFVLRPQDARMWKRTIFGQKLQLQLYCQAPGCWHPTESGGDYEITVPAEWFRVMAPYLRKLVKLLKYAHPVVGTTLGIGNPEVYERALSQDREYMQEIVANLPQLEGAEDLERVRGGMAEDFGLERL